MQQGSYRRLAERGILLSPGELPRAGRGHLHRVPHGRRLLLYLRTVLAYSLTVGCSSASAEPQVCAGAAAQPLFNGSSAETYLGLAPSEIKAIVEVVEGGRPDGALCTGAFVAPEWVVTARHCLQIPSAEVVVHDGESGRTVELPIADRIGHPTEDLALLRLDMAWSGTDVPPLEPRGLGRLDSRDGDK